MNTLFIFFTKPFKEHIVLLFLIFLLTSSISLYNWVSQGYYHYTLYLLSHNILVSYILILPVGCLKGKIKIIYTSILLTISSILFIFNSFCYLTLHSIFYADIVAIIGGTNLQEAKEYIESSVSINYILVVVSILFCFFLLSYLLFLIKPYIGIKTKIVGIIAILLGIIMTIHNPSIYRDGLYGEIQAFTQISKTPNLKDYMTNPQIKYVEKECPSNIVMIIGESFTKSHSSLYHYNKETNPRLTYLRNKGLLFTFNNVRSAMINTTKSFQTIMSTYKPEFKDSCKWYECTILPEIVKAAGYKTYWISNQSKVGLYDNVVGKYSELCDYSYFTGDKYSGVRRSNLDEEILDLLPPILTDTVSKNFYIIHLMGSHVAFKQRYPSHFNKFKANQYSNHPTNQQSILAEYDNSILYNDSIVYEIIQSYADKEAIILYFPDHGIDLFETSQTYYGHARATDSLSIKAGTNIPFIIYTTPRYKMKFKDKVKLIQENIHRKYRTDDIIYTIMDIIGIDFKNNNDVKKYSLLSN